MTPKTEAELASLVADAKGPFAIRGGGTRPMGRPVDGAPLSTSALSGITLYEPGALTLVACAGTPVAEIGATLAKENQRLPFEPMDYRGLLGTSGTPTIGGVVATNASGPRRVQVGAARDFLLGVRFVDGLGRVIKNGGRVMKNVTGYDLVKLMAGSYGNLGVMTEVSLKVLPDVESVATLTLNGLTDGEALRAMSTALGSPFEVSGVAHERASGVTRFRIEGFASSVGYRTDRLTQLLASFGAATLDADGSRQIWRDIRDVTALSRDPGDVWRLSVRPSDAPELVERSGADDALYDWGGGLVWLRLAEGTDLRARLGSFKGHATLVRASTEMRQTIASFHPEPAAIATLTRGLRQKFDPRGILNPGLMS